MIFHLINFIHLGLLFSPFIIFFINKAYFGWWFKYYVLILILTPLHWKFFDNKCILTILTKKIQNFKYSISNNSQFTENYLKWLYMPIMNILGFKWNSDNIEKASYIHWIINFVLIWYFIFYKYIK